MMLCQKANPSCIRINCATQLVTNLISRDETRAATEGNRRPPCLFKLNTASPLKTNFKTFYLIEPTACY